MKNHLTGFTSLLAVTLFANTAFPQTNSRPVFDSNSLRGLYVNVAGIEELRIKPNKAGYLKAKVARSIIRNFKEAENVSWKETKNNYVVTFKNDGRQAIAWFTKSGMLYCTYYYGTEKDLPLEEAKIIETYYRDYLILATAELKYQNGTAWVITIQNPYTIRKIKIVDGSFEEIETLRRAK